MTAVEQTTRMFRGARIGQRKDLAKAALPVIPALPPVDPDWLRAYALARGNEHKPWARRWLRANRLRFS